MRLCKGKCLLQAALCPPHAPRQYSCEWSVPGNFLNWQLLWRQQGVESRLGPRSLMRLRTFLDAVGCGYRDSDPSPLPWSLLWASHVACSRYLGAGRLRLIGLQVKNTAARRVGVFRAGRCSLSSREAGWGGGVVGGGQHLGLGGDWRPEPRVHRALTARGRGKTVRVRAGA